MDSQAFKALRLRLKLTQAQLGKLLHRSRAQIARYEAGEPIDGAIVELAERLDNAPRRDFK